MKKVLKEYFDYYNNDRTHLGIEKETPIDRQVSKRTSVSDKLVELPRIGGLYVAIVIARLVGLQISQEMKDKNI